MSGVGYICVGLLGLTVFCFYDSMQEVHEEVLQEYKKMKQVSVQSQ